MKNITLIFILISLFCNCVKGQNKPITSLADIVFDDNPDVTSISIRENIGETLTKDGFILISESQEPGIINNNKKTLYNKRYEKDNTIIDYQYYQTTLKKPHIIFLKITFPNPNLCNQFFQYVENRIKSEEEFLYIVGGSAKPDYSFNKDWIIIEDYNDFYENTDTWLYEGNVIVYKNAYAAHEE